MLATLNVNGMQFNIFLNLHLFLVVSIIAYSNAATPKKAVFTELFSGGLKTYICTSNEQSRTNPSNKHQKKLPVCGA
jgi:hypothetical protein